VVVVVVVVVMIVALCMDCVTCCKGFRNSHIEAYIHSHLQTYGKHKRDMYKSGTYPYSI
jgi:Fe-S-cluster containining protein